VNDGFDKFDPASQNRLVYEGEVKKKKEAILNKVKEVLFNETREVPSTKIMDALQLAERVFKTHKRDKKILVLFSDMVEESEYYNFKRENLTQKRIEQIISQEKAKGRLPDLSGVKVYVVGAAAGSYEKMPSEKIFGLQNFWLRYFKECGADLAKERYGGPLLEFEE
jgi:lysophospholipase L1-like esterase